MENGSVIQLQHLSTGEVLPQKLRVILLDDGAVQFKVESMNPDCRSRASKLKRSSAGLVITSAL